MLLFRLVFYFCMLMRLVLSVFLQRMSCSYLLCTILLFVAVLLAVTVTGIILLMNHYQAPSGPDGPPLISTNQDEGNALVTIERVTAPASTSSLTPTALTTTITSCVWRVCRPRCCTRSPTMTLIWNQWKGKIGLCLLNWPRRWPSCPPMPVSWRWSTTHWDKARATSDRSSALCIRTGPAYSG